MRIELSEPRTIDLNRGAVTWEASATPCDLCRTVTDLYRLLNSPDALCRSCFGMWHG